MALLVALHGNDLPFWAPLWLASEVIHAGTKAVAVEIPHTGAYIADGNVTTTGANYLRGEIVQLETGLHKVSGGKSQSITLRSGTSLPAPPPTLTRAGSLFTNF